MQEDSRRLAISTLGNCPQILHVFAPASIQQRSQDSHATHHQRLRIIRSHYSAIVNTSETILQQNQYTSIMSKSDSEVESGWIVTDSWPLPRRNCIHTLVKCNRSLRIHSNRLLNAARYHTKHFYQHTHFNIFKIMVMGQSAKETHESTKRANRALQTHEWHNTSNAKHDHRKSRYHEYKIVQTGNKTTESRRF